jgi:hypothetical protein
MGTKTRGSVGWPVFRMMGRERKNEEKRSGGDD